MEKPPRSKGGNIFKYLPKASTFAIRNTPYSPGRERRTEHPTKGRVFYNKAFSGPIVSIIPEEARRKNDYDAQEPTSPKISCMGQIKHKKKKCDRSRRPPPAAVRKERRPSFVKKMFRRKVRPGRRPDEAEEAAGPAVSAARAPGIGQMKRFTSGRETLAGFDWREAQRMDKGYDDDDEVMIPHSAPILMGGGVAMEPKKEVNIWKRRTLAPPIPLQLNH